MFSSVYFITDNHGHIKIGKADNAYNRLKELQVGNPYKLKVLLSIMMNSQNQAYKLETALHKYFKNYKLEGEWFEEAPVLDLINTEIVQIDRFKFGGLQYTKDIHKELIKKEK